MTAKSGRLMFVCSVAFAAAMCSDSPTAPTPTSSEPPPTASTPPPTTPTGPGNVELTARPNPVPFSGQPVTDAGPGCTNVKNTWFYEQEFKEVGGSEVTFRSRVDTFDGFIVNDLSGLNIVVPANGTLVLRSRWCSQTAAEHSARSRFTGTDARGNPISVTGPTVRLLRP
jgi:hypothetical protein